MKDKISGKFAIFLTSSLCYGMSYTCLVSLYSKVSCCIFYVPCMPWKIDILPFSSMNLEYTWNNQANSMMILFVLLLYVPSQQLWSLRDGQFT